MADTFSSIVADLEKMSGSATPAPLGVLAQMSKLILESIAAREAKHAEAVHSLTSRLDRQEQKLSALQKQLASIERKASK